MPIPKGFRYIEGTKNTGVVVENEADGSQFVWVPVTTEIVVSDYEPAVVNGDGKEENLTVLNNILATNYTSSDDFLKDLQSDFNSMAESVNKNDGFYVGRYETSLNSEKAQSVKGAISVDASTVYGIWYGIYAYQKKYSTDFVQGSMIWESQYDAMITWMQNTGVDVDASKGENGNTENTTGTKETDKINNIYDLYGNMWEWTLEAHYPYTRYVRSGNGPNSGFAMLNTDDTNAHFSSRLALYIK